MQRGLKGTETQPPTPATNTSLNAKRIERISSEGEKIIYIAAGPVSHVLSFYKTLLEKKGKENVRAIPLSPHK